jgi:hypothetical protein
MNTTKILLRIIKKDQEFFKKDRGFYFGLADSFDPLDLDNEKNYNYLNCIRSKSGRKLNKDQNLLKILKKFKKLWKEGHCFYADTGQNYILRNFHKYSDFEDNDEEPNEINWITGLIGLTQDNIRCIYMDTKNNISIKDYNYDDEPLVNYANGEGSILGIHRCRSLESHSLHGFPLEYNSIQGGDKNK